MNFCCTGYTKMTKMVRSSHSFKKNTVVCKNELYNLKPSSSSCNDKNSLDSL